MAELYVNEDVFKKEMKSTKCVQGKVYTVWNKSFLLGECWQIKQKGHATEHPEFQSNKFQLFDYGSGLLKVTL